MSLRFKTFRREISVYHLYSELYSTYLPAFTWQLIWCLRSTNIGNFKAYNHKISGRYYCSLWYIIVCNAWLKPRNILDTEIGILLEITKSTYVIEWLSKIVGKTLLHPLMRWIIIFSRFHNYNITHTYISPNESSNFLCMLSIFWQTYFAMFLSRLTLLYFWWAHQIVSRILNLRLFFVKLSLFIYSYVL